MSSPLTADLLVQAYRAGIFPMAEARAAAGVYWVDPRRRGVLPLDRIHLSHSLRKTLRQDRYRVTLNQSFEAVIDACAAPTPQRPETWINPDIRAAYLDLHQRGQAHSVESRAPDGTLVGGLYGVALGAAFFGESMFSLQTDASKVALAHLVAQLKLGGYRLLDTQFLTHHLAQFGACEIDRSAYRTQLAHALAQGAGFGVGPALCGDDVVQLITRTS